MKHGETEDAFMNFTSETGYRDASLTKLTTKNGNLSKKIRQQEYHISSLQSEIYKLKLATATQTTEVKGKNKDRHSYKR